MSITSGLIPAVLACGCVLACACACSVPHTDPCVTSGPRSCILGPPGGKRQPTSQERRRPFEVKANARGIGYKTWEIAMACVQVGLCGSLPSCANFGQVEDPPAMNRSPLVVSPSVLRSVRLKVLNSRDARVVPHINLGQRKQGCSTDTGCSTLPSGAPGVHSASKHCPSLLHPHISGRPFAQSATL